MNNLLEKVAAAPAVILDETVAITQDLADKTVAKSWRQAKNFWHMLGPGLTTGAADDDPSGIATYSQAGAGFGLGLLWLAAFTFPLMATVQEMCARIGLVTGRGLAANIRLHYPKWVLFTCTILLFTANTFNISVDLGAMAKAVQLLIPAASFAVLVVMLTLASLLLQIFMSYGHYARILKYLALVLVAYVFSTLIIPDIDWRMIAVRALLPSLAWSKSQIVLAAAVLGTTISPYLFFWQTSQEVEEEILDGKTTLAARRGLANKRKIGRMRADVWSGMFLSNLIMFFIITATAATLFAHGITEIHSATQAAEALRPLAGDGTYLLFALGIIGTGFLAVPVLAGSASYAVSESFGWKQGLFRRLKEASAFYGILIIAMIVGLGLNFIGLDPIRALIYAALANALVAPIVLILIVQLSSNRRVMGEHKSALATNLVGWLVIGLMVLAGAAAIASL